jgi:hypothetical protein
LPDVGNPLAPGRPARCLVPGCLVDQTRVMHDYRSQRQDRRARRRCAEPTAGQRAAAPRRSGRALLAVAVATMTGGVLAGQAVVLAVGLVLAWAGLHLTSPSRERPAGARAVAATDRRRRAASSRAARIAPRSFDASTRLARSMSVRRPEPAGTVARLTGGPGLAAAGGVDLRRLPASGTLTASRSWSGLRPSPAARGHGPRSMAAGVREVSPDGGRQALRSRLPARAAGS